MAVSYTHLDVYKRQVLGYVDTENYTYGELFNEINANTGGINCGVEVFDRADSTEEFQAMFSVRGLSLIHI